MKRALILSWLLISVSSLSRRIMREEEAKRAKSGKKGKKRPLLPLFALFASSSAPKNRKIRMLWVGCGAEDGAFAASKTFSEFLTKHNIKHTFRESGGAHTWIVWRRCMREISPLLFQ